MVVNTIRQHNSPRFLLMMMIEKDEDHSIMPSILLLGAPALGQPLYRKCGSILLEALTCFSLQKPPWQRGNTYPVTILLIRKLS
jgi:hypothetical protein